MIRGAAAAVSTALIGCSSRNEPSHLDEIVVAVADLPRVLDPLHNQAQKGTAYAVLFSLFDQLAKIERSGSFEVSNALATEWHRLDDLTVDLVLRPDVRFHSGELLTAEDVEFSFGPARMSGHDAPGRGAKGQHLPSIAKVTATGPLSVRIQTHYPDPVLFKSLGAWGGQIISKRAYEATGDWEEWNQNPIGSGPYKVKYFDPGRELVVVAHNDYWSGRPQFKSIKFVKVGEVATRVIGLAGGDFDLITNIMPDHLKGLSGRPDLELMYGPPDAHRCILYDTRNPHLADVNVRRALSLAINREQLVKYLWDGTVEVPSGPQWKQFGEVYDQDRLPPQYDPELAMDLLSQSDYNGEEIPYRFISPDHYPFERATAEVLAEMWSAIGVRVRLELCENFAQVYSTPGVGIRNSGDAMIFPDPVATLWRRYGEGSRMQRIDHSWSDAAFNEAGALLARSLDETVRSKALREMLDIYSEKNPPGTLLHTMNDCFGKRRSLDWTPNANVLDFGPRNMGG